MPHISHARVRTGLDVLLAARLDLVRGSRVGLITNPTGITADVTVNVDALLAHSVHLAALFGPEHGFYSRVEDGLGVTGETHARTGLPIHSLYGPDRRPTADMLRGVDVLLFDIQDVGVRFYTYVWTMALCMQAAAERGIPFIVLDRPNPITGHILEGPLLAPDCASFVGLYPVLLRHGLTIGEMARLLNAEFGLGADLTVVPLDGWRRDMWFADTGLPWVAPSPNIPSLTTTVVYPGMCLVEGTNLSEGRGTTKPFELIGAPWLDGEVLADRLNGLDLPGVRFRSVMFVPTFSKYAGEMCRGVQPHVLDLTRCRPVAMTLHLISEARRLHRHEFGWWPTFPEGDRPFDRLVGRADVRVQIEAGVPVADIVAAWDDDRRAWAKLCETYRLYAGADGSGEEAR